MTSVTDSDTDEPDDSVGNMLGLWLVDCQCLLRVELRYASVMSVAVLGLLLKWRQRKSEFLCTSSPYCDWNRGSLAPGGFS